MIVLESGRVHVLAAVATFVKRLVNVFATLRSQKVASKKVFNPLFVCAEARTISHPHAGTVNAHCPFRYLLESFGGVGTAPPTVAVIVGRSALVAVVNIPLTILYNHVRVFHRFAVFHRAQLKSITSPSTEIAVFELKSQPHPPPQIESIFSFNVVTEL